MLQYVKDMPVVQNARAAFSRFTLFVLTLLGIKAKTERQAYDIFSIGVQHPEVPLDAIDQKRASSCSACDACCTASS